MRTSSPTTDPADAPVSSALGAALGLPVGACAALLTWAFAPGTATGLVLAGLAAGALGAVTTPVGALCAATLCWGCYDGFVVNRFGTLGFTHPELAALALLAACAALPAGVTAAVRARSCRHAPGYASVVSPPPPHVGAAAG